MQTKEYTTKDKSTWGEGPWQNEPDKMQFMTEQGFPALIVRNHGGALCGYVGVPQSHPWFGIGYDDVDVDVHGGLTFANHCSPNGNEAEHICHIVEDGEDDRVWWLGFDCAHSGDKAPAMDATYKKWNMLMRGDEYRTIEYVKNQIALLAQQVKEAA